MDDILKFIADKGTYKGVNKDLWNMFTRDCCLCSLYGAEGHALTRLCYRTLLGAGILPHSAAGLVKLRPRWGMVSSLSLNMILVCAHVLYQAWPTMLDDFVTWKKSSSGQPSGAQEEQDIEIS
ncbi:hypothetical protein C8Q70DRAFT_416723 [Cubamyces menziesii]|nr:hypothetical protein C8Q70DRAFT_416723 [Cubamyces menziesii]